MQIRTDTATGDHKGICFALKEGVLVVDGVQYSRAKIRGIVEIANLLGVEGFTIKEQLPKDQRSSGGYDQYGNFYHIDPALDSFTTLYDEPTLEGEQE